MIFIKRAVSVIILILIALSVPLILCSIKAEGDSTTHYIEETTEATTETPIKKPEAITVNKSEVITFKYTHDEVWTVVNVNFRSDHSEDAEKIGLICGDTKLERIGITSNNWTYVKYNDVFGFVHSDYLTDEEPSAIFKYESEDDFEYLGEWKITGYTSDPADNGGYKGDCKGRPLIPWYGCASDLPLGTMLMVEGLGVFEVRDRGVRGKHLDIVTNSNAESYAITGYYHVYIMR